MVGKYRKASLNIGSGERRGGGQRKREHESVLAEADNRCMESDRNNEKSNSRVNPLPLS